MHISQTRSTVLVQTNQTHLELQGFATGERDKAIFALRV
jgi:hypothetical protein